MWGGALAAEPLSLLKDPFLNSTKTKTPGQPIRLVLMNAVWFNSYIPVI